MDKRLLLAIALSFALLFIWNTVLFPPPPPPETPESAPPPGEESRVEAIPPSEVAPPPPGVAPGEGADSPVREDLLAPSEAGRLIASQSREERTVETGVYRIRVTNEGAKILGWELRHYRDDDGNPLEIVSPGAPKLKRFPMRLDFRDERLAEKIDQALFQMEEGLGEHGQGKRITFHYADGRGLEVIKVLDLAPDSYLAHLEIGAWLNGQRLEGELVWGAGFGPFPGRLEGNLTGADAPRAIFSRGGKIVRVAREKVEEDQPQQEDGPLGWAGLEDHYFAGLYLPVGGTGGVTIHRYRVIEEGREKDFLSLGIALASSGHYDLYVGPKDYDLLAGMHIGLEGLVNFGFFGSIAQALFFLLKHINRVTGNWGWSIIILTFFIRLAFFPLTHRSSVNMRRTQEKMKKVNPKVQAIRDRYKRMKKDMANRQKMNDEIMALYKKEGVNPLSSMTGCLPLLLQMPILWGFYNLLNAAIELRHAPFAFWIEDLSKKDPYYVTPIVMGATMLIQQLMTASTIPDPTQRRMMMMMPLIFTWFFKDFPSGLVIYWLVNNVLAIGQQYLINTQAARHPEPKKVVSKPST